MNVPNLVFGMHHLNITQLPQGSFSHPNNTVDLAGEDAGIDFWFAKCTRYKCIAGPWGNGTYFFVPCDEKGNQIDVMCADGKQRKVTLALTHSARKYVKTTVGKIYELNQPMYEEGTVGFATGNHIHLEVAEGYQTTKTYDSKLGVYTMKNELNPIKVMYVLDGFTTVTATKGATLKHTSKEYTVVAGKKTNEEIAEEVWAGKWGTGDARKKALTEAGYDYTAIQKLVDAGVGKPADKLNVLFLGNSYTYKPNTSECLPQQFKAIAKANGKDLDVTMIAEGGKTLEWLFNNTSVATALKSKKHKYVVIQGQSEEVGCADGKLSSNAKTYSKKLIDLAKQYGAKVFMFAQADYYFVGSTKYNMKYQDQVDANYKTMCGSDATVCYGGKEVKKQANGNYASYFESDGYHPTAKAQKIIAQVIYDAMFPVELPQKLTGDYAPTLAFTQSDTNKIVNAHRYDFGVDTFNAYMKAVGGYNKYVKSLGGVFAKHADHNKTSIVDYTAKTAKEFQECADYVMGLMTIYGVNYTDENGKKVWGSNGGVYGSDAFYNAKTNIRQFFNNGTNKNGYKVSIDQILSGETNGGMMTNCGWTVTYIFKKAGLIPKDAENMEVEFYGDMSYHKYYRNKGAKILTPKNSADFQIGDVIGFYGSGTGFTYKHCCVVVDVDKEKGTYTIFDGGSARFTNTRGCNVVGKLGDSPLYGSYKSFKVLRLPLSFAVKEVKAKGTAGYFNKGYAGVYEVTAKDGLHIRDDGMQTAQSLGVLPYKTKFESFGYFDKDSKGRIWLYGIAESGVKYTGFCCFDYLKKA